MNWVDVAREISVARPVDPLTTTLDPPLDSTAELLEKKLIESPELGVTTIFALAEGSRPVTAKRVEAPETVNDTDPPLGA
jgi:hypothetical protein